MSGSRDAVCNVLCVMLPFLDSHSPQNTAGRQCLALIRLCSDSDIFPNAQGSGRETQLPSPGRSSAAITSWVFSNLDTAICFPSPHKNMHKKGANQQILSFQRSQLGWALPLGTKER
jgi:hypothetical protein